MDTSVIHDDDTLTFTDVYSLRAFYQLLPELPQTYICIWSCLPIVLKHTEFKLDIAYVLMIITIQNIYVILTLILNCETEKFMIARQLKYWLSIAVYLAVKD